jgi:signal peptidase I
MNEFEKEGLLPEESSLPTENEEQLEPISETVEETVVTSDGEIVEAVKKSNGSKVLSIYEYVETFCYALALMMVLFLFVFRYVKVDGDSMKHTLHNEDKLIISNLFYQPETGDIIVLNPESHGEKNEPIIKRVIATEGQTVYIDYENWEVYVDGEKLDEPYIDAMREEMQAIMGRDIAMRRADDPKYSNEFVVGENKVFVMGDNRNNSKDSRSREYGEIGENRILGKVVIRLAPDFGFVE